MLSVWRKMGQSQWLFNFGPLGELWWGFVRWESHHHISHQPRTAAKCWLCLSMQASVQLGTIPYIFLKKIRSILGGESVCIALQAEKQGLLCPSALGAAVSPRVTSPRTATLSQQGWGCSVAYGVGGNGTISTLGKRWIWTKKLSLCLGKAIYGWSQPSVWWLLYVLRHGDSRCDNWWTYFLESQELKVDASSEENPDSEFCSCRP